MALPTNDDFSNRELSIEELEALAAGWPSWVHDAVHAVENFVTHHPLAAGIIGGVGFAAGGVGYALLVSMA